jgi:hypothetical protein
LTGTPIRIKSNHEKSLRAFSKSREFDRPHYLLIGRMIFVPSLGDLDRLRRNASRPVFLLLLAIHALSSSSLAALPKRLVLLLDGVSYRDMKALQEGVTHKDIKGRQFHRQGFHQGYFPVSRLVSTFPSASDVAWTEIFGNRPLPGYQRTYFSRAANTQILRNGITTSMEYEKQMNWQVESGFRRGMAYVHPIPAFKYEVRELVENFLNTSGEDDNYYAMIRSTDDAQHMARDIFAMLSLLDEKLQELRVRYKAREGRDLEILILSDHGNNHAGAGQRVEVRSYLKKAGYRITKSIQNPKDVVLPTVGIESWVELHNSPAETERLVQLLSHLKGVDVLTAQVPGRTNRFIVMSSKGERAIIGWNSAKNSFRYSTETGDPLNYQSVVAALSKKNQFDSDGFATADAWMAETLDHRYPLALERIVRGHTRVTLNPASILISLRNDYVHAGWLVKKASGLVRFGGTHGGLDDLNSNGILLSSFAPTKDTSTSRVAALFDGFAGLHDYRAQENGAEWVSRKAQAMTTIARVPLDGCCSLLPSDEVLLRVWTPRFTRFGLEAPVEVTFEKVLRFPPVQIRRGDPKPFDASERHLTLNLPLSFPERSAYERVYVLPPDLGLEPQKLYRISARIRDQKKNIQIFSFTFCTDSRGLPVAY